MLPICSPSDDLRSPRQPTDSAIPPSSLKSGGEVARQPSTMLSSGNATDWPCYRHAVAGPMVPQAVDTDSDHRYSEEARGTDRHAGKGASTAPSLVANAILADQW